MLSDFYDNLVIALIFNEFKDVSNNHSNDEGNKSQYLQDYAEVFRKLD